MKEICSIIASLRKEYRTIQAGMYEAIMSTRKPHAGVREPYMIKIQLMRNQYFMYHDSLYRVDNCKINTVG